MGIKIHRSWVSENPSGVVINPGWYALAEAILTKQSCCVVLQKWCGVSESRGWKEKDTSCTGEKMKQIIKIYKRHRGKIPNHKIAEQVGCTREYVCIVLKKKLGVGKRNRWEGYIRPDHGRHLWGEGPGTVRPGYGLYDRALGPSAPTARH